MVGLFFLVVLTVSIFVASFFVPKVTGHKGDPSPRFVTRCLGAFFALITVIVLLLSSIATVGTKDIGVLTAYGHTEGDLGPGIHLIAPWDSVTIMDGAIQTKTFEGANAIPIKLAYQQTATANVTIRWRIEQDHADALFQNYRDFSNIRDSLVDRNVGPAVNSVVSNYNPLNGIDSTGSNPTMAQIAQEVTNVLDNELKPQGIDVLSVIMPPFTYDPTTQARLNQLQQQVAQTRIANQEIQTNQAQAKANAALAQSVNTSPNVLKAQCLNDLNEMIKQSMTPPAGFDCGLGSGVGSVIAH